MSETSGGLPLMAQTQNSRYLTYNEAMWAINVLQTGVLDRDLTSPPGSPSEGDAYIVNATATGSWAGKEDKIAFYFGGIWNFLEPELAQGNGVYVDDEDLRVRWNGSSYEIETGAEASTIPYTPGVGSSWGSPEPTTVGEALDQASAGGPGGGASTTQTGEMLCGFIQTAADKDYRLVVKAAHGGTITETTTRSESGTCTATFKVNTTALGGTANSVSSSEQSQAHASSNTFAAGDDIVLTVSSNSSCLGLSFTIKYTRTLA